MNWIQKNFKSLIYVAFLVPILAVAFVSISHVTKWYGLSNPINWAVYLSVGIEIAALSALAAISAKMGNKVYFPFIIVTVIQFIGNIFFAYQYIDISSESFKDWIDLVDPLVSFMGVESGDIIGHKRFLALFSGGMLPIISLSFLHMLVKFEEEEKKKPIVDKQLEKIDIDELSIAAGKEEAKYVEEKYTPNEKELLLFEEKLREINENKFKRLEEIVEDTEEESLLTELENVIHPIEITETTPETIIIDAKLESIETTPAPIIIEAKLESIETTPEPVIIETVPIPVSYKPNKLSYSNRNGSNVSVQRI
jgi:hypothetical protein